ncbi:MAG: ABC transporter substrate-binding protein [Betaproteobacteria bacterium]|nr:ABC transporter substrate-binding protein [Betaproteobacteria bacterium]
MRFCLYLVLTLSAASLQAQTIKLGELNSYKVFPAFLEPYKKGMELALEEINAKGGAGGHKLELVIRDDGGTPGDAVRVAEELIAREKVDLLMGTFASNVGLAVANLANQRKVVFLASEPLTDKLVWEDGNPYTFRLRPSTYMQVAMLIPEAAKLRKKRWALVYPNYEYGQSAAASFKKLLARAQPDVEFVAEQATPLNKIDAGAVTQALADAKPDAIFSALFAVDLQKFVREGNTRRLFAGRPVFNLLAGEPEYLDPLKDETPEGWWVTGYPWKEIDTPAHRRFRDAYRKRWNDYPRAGSVVGYTAVYSAAGAIAKAGGAGADRLIAALKGLQVDMPFATIAYRALDHQSTMGAYIGRLAKKDGQGTMVDWRYVDGASVQPPDAEVRALRKE